MAGWFLGGGWLFLIVGFVFYYGLNGCGGFVVMGCWRGGKTGLGMGCRCGFAGCGLDLCVFTVFCVGTG